MTTATNGNAILRNGIVLHVIYVMNNVSAFLANRASVIVAFTNHALKPRVKGWRVWFKGFSAHPSAAILADIPRETTGRGAEVFSIAISARRGSNVFLSALRTNKIYAILASNVKAFLGTIFSARIAGRYHKNFLALWTRDFFLAPFPQVRLTTAICESTPAGRGAELSWLSSYHCIGEKLFPAKQAGVFIHLDLIKGASRLASRIVVQAIRLNGKRVGNSIPTIFCLNNQIIPRIGVKNTWQPGVH